MSSGYRDDIQETIVISSSAFGITTNVAEDSVRIIDTTPFKIMFMIKDTLAVLDSVDEHRLQLIQDQVLIQDTSLAHKVSESLITDSLKIKDTIYSSNHTSNQITETLTLSEQIAEKTVGISWDSILIDDQFKQTIQRTQIVIERCLGTDIAFDHLDRVDITTDQIIATDVILDHICTTVVDQVQITDHDKTYKQANVIVKEKAHVTDRSIRVHADTVMDALRVSDTVNACVRATEAIREHVVISDKLQSSIIFSQHITEKLIIHDVAKGSLTAKQHLQDYIFIDDLILNQPTTGYAWTANADTWAMSRYDSYNYCDLAVIDGVLYGLGEDGVYRLDADTLVQGKLVTGKIDLGRGQLVHPVAAYLEYELLGSSKQLQVGVGTTQSGTKQTYFYQLPTETADDLTNGRVLFGRGLRGRHFSFEINISGERGYINDLNIDLAATKRRV